MREALWGPHPDDRRKLVEEWQLCLASGTPIDTEACIRRFGNIYRRFLIRANPLRDESGNILKWCGTGTDIEGRKRAEEAVLANEQNVGLIISTMPVLAWAARADGNVDFVNQRWLDYTGLSPA
jgi:PAS domain-containing protein